MGVVIYSKILFRIKLILEEIVSVFREYVMYRASWGETDYHRRQIVKKKGVRVVDRKLKKR